MSNFENSMKSWVKMVSEGRYTTQPEDAAEGDVVKEASAKTAEKMFRDELEKDIDSYFAKVRSTGKTEGNLKECDGEEKLGEHLSVDDILAMNSKKIDKVDILGITGGSKYAKNTDVKV